jgi:hypothetical protein
MEQTSRTFYPSFSVYCPAWIRRFVGALETLERRVVGGVRQAGKIMAAMKTLLEADRCLPKLHALFRDSVETLGSCSGAVQSVRTKVVGSWWCSWCRATFTFLHFKCTRFDYWRRHVLFFAEIIMVLYSGHPVWRQ